MSILGIGTDIVEVPRIRALCERHGERFAARILSPNELAPNGGSGVSAPFLARRFAAKEAAVKALGTGMARGIRFRDIAIQHEPGGQPRLAFDGGALARCHELGIARSHVSISDERRYAMAFVVIERD